MRRFGNLLLAALATFVVGLAVVGTYVLLAHFRIGSVGAPDDIGGGIIALIGASLMVIGVGLATVGLVLAAADRAGFGRHHD